MTGHRRASLFLAGLFLALSAPFPAAPVASAATLAVMMQGYAFSPATMTVHVGDTITWMQHDQAPHDVVTTSAPVAFRSPQLSQGQSWSYTFRQAGTYAYYCSVHPDMRASVTVLPAATTPQPKPTTTTAVAAVPGSTRKTVSPTKTGTTAAGSQPVAPTTAPSPVTPSEPAQPDVQQAAASAPSLDPMLLVAGIVTAIAVLCLLLLGSRQA
jgi:plastocyanin